MQALQIRSVVTGLIFMFTASAALAWDGQDVNSGASIEIERGNLVRSGEDIEIYDYDAGKYRDVTVESVSSSGMGAEVEVYDSDTGEYRTFEME